MQPPFSNQRSDIQLLVVDIDGTIAGPSNDVNPAVLKALQQVQAQGIPVALATGRMYRSAVRFHQTIGSTLPLIAYQGAWIQDPTTQQLHRHQPLATQYVAELLDYFAQPALAAAVSIHLYLDDQLYVQAVATDTDDYSSRSGVTPIAVDDLRLLGDRQPTKLLAMSQDIDLIAQALADLKQRYQPHELYLTTSTSTFLEAADASVNKGAAVRYLAEEVLGLSADQVMAIGDNCNDLEMLQYVGCGVAMGDAPEIVKSVAQWVAPNVEADGVAVAIERFILTSLEN